LQWRERLRNMRGEANELAAITFDFLIFNFILF